VQPPPPWDDVVALRAALERDAAPRLTGPFETLLGYRWRPDAQHGLHLELEVGERHLSQYGIAHGGVALALLDAVGGIAAAWRVERLVRIATISLAASFIRAVEPGRVVASARSDHLGSAIAHMAMTLRAGGSDGPLLATATAAYRLFRGREPHADAPAAGER
jgi:uncharacterized protein (TIGR00369 family)